jgi:regulator of protease activity HflC (stomatin/prohibitin superfamily)
MLELFSLVSAPLVLFIAILILGKQSIRIVPQNQVLVIERFGQYVRTLEAGLNFIVPFVERPAYQRSLKEEAINVSEQIAITKDNIQLRVDGIIYIKVLDAYKSSYGVEDYHYAISQLAQTTMRAELGKMDLDDTFQNRESLNVRVVESINSASAAWGVAILRYELRDITPPESVKVALESQMTAEREKRAAILESEAEKQSAINTAEGEKRAAILKAEGVAQSVTIEAQAQAKAITTVGAAMATEEGRQAAQLELAKEAIQVKAQLAKTTNTVIVPDEASNANSLIATAMSVMEAVKRKHP